MKKILSTAVLAVLAVGTVFAAEPKITMKYRTRANVYSQSKTKSSGTESTETKMFKQDASSACDAFKLEAKADYAGVVMEFNVNDKFSAKTEKINNTAYDVKADDNAVTVSNYYGWMNFGALKFTAGKFDSRFTNRVDEGIGEISLVDESKLGVRKTVDKFGSTSTNYKYIGVDSNNMGATAGSKSLAFTADYTITDALPGTLLLKAALLKNTYDTDSKATDKKDTASGYGLEAAYTAEKFSADFVLKMPAKDQTVFGVFVKPIGVVDGLNATVGFTYASDSKDYDSTDTKSLNNGNKRTEMAIDARASYKISDALKTIFHLNYTTIKQDAAFTSTTIKEFADLWLAAEVSYIVNDKLTVGADVAYENKDMGKKLSGSENGVSTLTIQPMAVFTAGKGATISTGFKFLTVLDKGDETKQSEMSIPMTFRVAL